MLWVYCVRGVIYNWEYNVSQRRVRQAVGHTACIMEIVVLVHPSTTVVDALILRRDYI